MRALYSCIQCSYRNPWYQPCPLYRAVTRVIQRFSSICCCIELKRITKIDALHLHTHVEYVAPRYPISLNSLWKADTYKVCGAYLLTYYRPPSSTRHTHTRHDPPTAHTQLHNRHDARLTGTFTFDPVHSKRWRHRRVHTHTISHDLSRRSPPSPHLSPHHTCSHVTNMLGDRYEAPYWPRGRHAPQLPTKG